MSFLLLQETQELYIIILPCSQTALCTGAQQGTTVDARFATQASS